MREGRGSLCVNCSLAGRICTKVVKMYMHALLAKEVCEALPAHGFGVPDLYPERSMMTPTTRNMKVRETYAQCVVLQTKFLLCVDGTV